MKTPLDLAPHTSPGRRSALALLAAIVAATMALAVPLVPLPACPIHQTTGLLCPGCGATRALTALLHGHLAQAFGSNALTLALLSLAALYLALLLRRLWQANPHPFPRVPRAATLALLMLTAAFTLVRNLPR